MLLELPPLSVALLNCVGLPALQVGLAWLFTRLPAGWFARDPDAGRADPDGRHSGFQRGRWRWKRWLPDGASWFAGGFPKARLAGREEDYLSRFMAETLRGEWCHWTFLLLSPVFFLWNPPWACMVIAAYSLAANVPCILVQRLNRRRLATLLRRARHHSRRAARFEHS